jgi:two-component system, chemotaxis family, sensor kinase CheA
VNGSVLLDELLAVEIEKRLGADDLAVEPAELRILLHSLRGSVAMAGYADLALVIGQLDQRYRQREPNIERVAIDLLRDVAARLRAGLPPLETQWPVPPAVLVPSAIDAKQRVEYRAAMLDRLLELDTVTTLQEPSREAVEQAYRLVHSMKGHAGSVGDDSTAWYCHGLETRLRAALDDHQLSSELLAQLARHSATIARLLDNADEAFAMLRALSPSIQARNITVSPTIHPSSRSSSRPAPPSWVDELEVDSEVSLRVPNSTVERIFDHLEHVDVSAEEMLSTAGAAGDVAHRLRKLDHELMDLRRAALPVHGEALETSLAYRLECVARELREQETETARLASICNKNSELLRSQWAEIRAVLSHLRRTKLSWLFERVASAAQRFAHGEGKRVRVHGAGGDISLERGLAERLLEAVMQVVRNSISHGIVEPEARMAAGKDAEGLITMSARRQGDWLCLTVDDDGRGVDVQRVRQLAVERGVASARTAQHLGQSELYNLLFLPGLSTRRGPDVLAGRGVGLDLARDIMHRLGGTLRLSSIVTGGVRASLELPIEHGLVDVVWLESSAVHFALPVTYTGRVRQSNSESPAITLATCVGLPPTTTSAIEIEIAVPGVKPIAIGIDALGEVEEVVVRPLPPILSQLGPYAGAVLRGDGSLRLMLDAAIVSGELWKRVGA